jgi:hypothetical protein
MPAKTAIGKGVKVAYPSKGTIKSNQGASASTAASLQRSKTSTGSSSSKIEKTEQADPAEIIAVADFNRVYDSSKELTPYGEYYRTLDVVHSVTTDDVNYVVSRAVESDTSGQWKALRDNTEASIDDASDFNEDLANVAAKIEQACKSLNFMRTGDIDLQEAAEMYLTGKVREYETQPENRTIDIDNVLPADLIGNKPTERFASSGGSVAALKQVLSDVIADSIVKSPNDDFFYNVGQSNGTKELNPTDPKGLVWEYVDKLTNGARGSGSARMVQSSKMLSHILSLSAGITKINESSIARRISFSPARIGSIFEGAKSDSVTPYRQSKKSPNYGSDLIALSLLQFETSDGSITVPVESEDSTGGEYKSGVRSLIRDPISNGDYLFGDFASFAKSFEESRQDIEEYSEMILGYLDPDNKLTPLDIHRIIVSNFIDALEAAKSNVGSKYQLLYTSMAGNATDSSADFMRQRLLQIAGRIKWYQLRRGEAPSGAGDDAASKTTLVTTKVSEGSESLRSSATPTTTQTEDKSSNPTESVVSRNAQGSPASDILAVSMVGAITSTAKEGGPTAATLQYLIEEKREELLSLKSRYSYYAGLSVTDDSYKSFADYYKKRVDTTTSYINDLSSQLSVTPAYDDVATVRSYFEDAMKVTEGTFWSSMIKAYDQVIGVAQKRLPANSKMTDTFGRTLHGSFDEFGLLSLIVESFVALSAPLSLYVQKSATGTVEWNDAFEDGINAAELYEDMLAVIESSIPHIAVMGYSAAALSDYREELLLLTSDSPPEDLSDTTFNSAKSVKSAMDSLSLSMRRYQNAMAQLKSFSSVMMRSKDDLVSAFSNIFESSSRRAALDNPQGRKTMSSLTNQQMVYRRSLLDKYKPLSTTGYLPARFSYSRNESEALSEILSSRNFCSRSSENLRIVSAGIPAGTIDSSKSYNDPDLGKQSYTGLIELMIHKRDHEFDDLIFEEKTFLFDPQLYVVPDSFVNYKRSRSRSSSDVVLNIAKKLNFRLYSRDESKIVSYDDLSSDVRYQNLTKSQIDEVVKNSTLSYLLETYLFKTTGMVFDESVTLTLDDSISGPGQSALIALAGQNLPDLVLPSAAQLDSMIDDSGEVDYLTNVPNVTTGDRELIAALGSSYIMKSEKPIDRLLSNCGFDRVMIVAVDPDDFYIDRAETIKKNGQAGRQMLKSMQKQGLLVSVGSKYRIIPRDPLAGGFAIGDITCQFVPHTASKTEGGLLKLAKDVSKLKSEISTTLKKTKTATKAAKAGASKSISSKAKLSKGVKL